MIDLKHLREQPDLYRKGAALKKIPVDVDRLIELDQQRRATITKAESLRAEQKKIEKELGPQMGKLSGQLKAAQGADRDALQAQLDELKSRPNVLKTRIASLETELTALEPEFNALLLQVPIPPDADVPVGQSSDDNIELRRWNSPSFDTRKSFRENKGFDPKTHLELVRDLKLADFERGVKLAGSRSYTLLGDGMRLHQAVTRFAIDFMSNQQGFTPVSVPVLVREEAMIGTGFFPAGREQAYHIPESQRQNPDAAVGGTTLGGTALQSGASESSGGTAVQSGASSPNPRLTTHDPRSSTAQDLFLTGTGEVGLMGLHMGEILDEAALPLKYVTLSTCFRREAGAAGKDTAGLYRIHQFDKVEQVVICRADAAESRAWHQKMIGYVEEILRALEIPHRLLQCCTADLGPKNADMIDIESWMPGRGELDATGRPTGAFGETHSASRLYDFQCRRLNMRYREGGGSGKGETVFCHSLNNTVIASPRILIPLLEIHQNQDGSVTIPAALRPYLGGRERIG